MIRAALAALLGALAPAPAASAGLLDLPAGAELAGERHEAPGTLDLPLSGWAAGGLRTDPVEGALLRQAWQVPTPDTTLGVLAPLRAQLQAAGFTILLDCETRACGGFDFRYATLGLPEPAMHVDLGDFRFVSARRDTAEGPEAVTLLVSRRGGQAFVEVAQVRPVPAPGGAALPLVTATKTPEAAALGPAGEPAAPAPAPGTLADGLARDGRAVLDGVTFAPGSAQLQDGAAPALEALASWLAADPAARIALVGHTDAEGALAGNVALSRARAGAVAERLRQQYGIAADRVLVEGVGFLVPQTSNATDQGRSRNRRVEVVVLPPG